MNPSFLIDLISNAALLITLGLFYDIFAHRQTKENNLTIQPFFGVGIGLIAIVLMSTPADFAPGIIFDTRTILLCITGLYFGPLTTIIAILTASAYRYHLGGAGTLAGIATIATSGGVGIFVNRYRQQREKALSLGELYGFGLVVHIVMLLCMLFLPAEMIRKTIMALLFPAVVVYPVATALLGYLLASRQRRFQIDQRLAESEYLHRTILQTAMDGIVRTDRNGRILEVNNSYCQMSGYSQEELLALSIEDLEARQTPEEIRQQLQKLLDVETVNFETQHRCKNGELIDFEIGIKTLDIRDNQFVAFLHNITERKQTEKSLQESEATFRKLFEDSSDAILLIDNSGVFVECNQAALDLLKMTREQFLFLPPVKISPEFQPDGRRSDEAALEMIEIAYAKGKNRFDWTCINSEGGEFVVEVSLMPITIKGQTMLHTTWRDMTERKKAEQNRLDLEAQLRQKYKMEAVGVMAGGMAHNFNNNLSIILGSLELAKRKLPMEARIGNYLDQAKTAALRSRDLIVQIMTYSRKEQQQVELVQLSRLIDEVLDLLKSTIPSSVYMQERIDPDSAQAYIRANASQIQEILLNLCNNAVHAMGEKGRLTVGLKIVELKQEQIPAHYACMPGSYLCLSVQDTGCGMTTETLDKIFDPFFTTKEMHEGTGMGLSSVQGIIEQLRGMIKVESHVGQGTTFDLYFPVSKETSEGNPSLMLADSLPRGSEHILLVDDYETVLGITQEMLKEMGYQVTFMTDSLAAYKLFATAADSFQLLITDQTMPGLTGKELIQKVKKIRPDIPTILCTGYSSKVEEGNTKEFGIDAFLMKPLDMQKLLQTVRRVLDEETG